MWGVGNIFERAREGTASVLEKTGDALTDFATDHVARGQGPGGGQGGEGGGGGEKAAATADGTESSSVGTVGTTASTRDSNAGEKTAAAAAATTATSTPESSDGGVGGGKVRDGGAGASRGGGGTDDVRKKMEAGAGAGAEGGGVASEAVPPTQQQQQPNNRFAGWGSGLIGATRSALENTRQTLQAAGSAQGGAGGLFRSNNRNDDGRRHPQRRDPDLPLDTASLRDAEVVYVTDRLITMGHPALQSPTDGDITPARKLAAVAQLLAKRHQGRYMVWNLSEVEYDYSIMDDQVLAYQFPGSPSPPLGLLLKLIFSMESWLKADPRNVAVVHCLTGKGRTSTVLACFLCWMGEAGFHDPMRALEYIALCKRCNVDQLTIPSQRRYVSYFGNMLDGVRPHHPPLLLKRVIMSEAPKYEKPPKSVERNATDGSRGVDSTPQLGCSPYVQIFKGGQLIFTTAASMSYSQEKDELPFCLPYDGSISFPVETVVQGDILIRCRHLTQRGKRVSMFRAAFHTGYTPAKVLRLGKAQLDGACTDKRFADDFFIDLVFEACDAATASRHLLSLSSRDLSSSPKEKPEEMGGKDTNASKGGADSTTAASGNTEQSVAALQDVTHNTAAARRARATLGASGGTDNPQAAVTASTYDSMLHRDARFWNVIGSRRQENMTKLEEEQSEKAGPTIGRRRDASAMMLRNKKEEGGAGSEGGQRTDGGDDSQKSTQESPENNVKQAMQSFSIGFGIDFDFAQDDGDQVQGSGNEAEGAPPPQTPPKRDELMEALMALDDDVGSPPSSFNEGAPAEEQEIVFEDEGGVEDNGATAPDIGATPSPADDKRVETDPPSDEIGIESESANDKSAAAEMNAGKQPELNESESVNKESIVNDNLGGSSDTKEKRDSTDLTEEKSEETLQAGTESTTVEVVEPSSQDAVEAEGDAIGDNRIVGVAPDVSVGGKIDADMDVDAAADVDVDAAADVDVDVDVDVDDFDFDDDDAELDDLENFLMKSGK